MLKNEFGIYIHIPFCIKKCDYCDFISFSDKFDKQEIYINKILEEIENNRNILENKNITTIYIGGGTPSSINEINIEKILNKIYRVCDINQAKKEKLEITIEVNPGTANKNKFEVYRKCGINRLSIGLQTTSNYLLKQIGRIHNYEDFFETYQIAQNKGFENINIDLMIGLPKQSLEDIKKSLNEVIKLKPTHISVYSLIIEEGTKISELINIGELELSSEEDERNQYAYVKNILELNGYNHYEISNFAKPDFESKHNINCWKQQEYIGFGVAAHSYIEGLRYSNTNSIEEYLKNTSSKIIQERLTKVDMQREYMVLGLRMLKGVSILNFKKKFGENPLYLFKDEINKLYKDGLIVVDLDYIRLTRRGLDLANIVWSEFV